MQHVGDCREVVFYPHQAKPRRCNLLSKRFRPLYTQRIENNEPHAPQRVCCRYSGPLIDDSQAQHHMYSFLAYSSQLETVCRRPTLVPKEDHMDGTNRHICGACGLAAPSQLSLSLGTYRERTRWKSGFRKLCLRAKGGRLSHELRSWSWLLGDC